MSPIDVAIITTGPPFGSGLVAPEQLGNVKKMAAIKGRIFAILRIIFLAPQKMLGVVLAHAPDLGKGLSQP
jgi:hypothetical protein